MMKYFIFLLCAGIVSSCNSNNKHTSESNNTSGICNTSFSQTDNLAKPISDISIKDSVMMLYNYDTMQHASYKYTFLEFGAVGCAPCKKMEKEMETIKSDFAGKVNVRFINISKKWNKDWADYFEIRTIPTQVVLDYQGNEIYRHVGYIPADELKKVFK